MNYFDNTRIVSYKTCPRKFYLRHRKHWSIMGTAAPLAFGSAWHEALNVVWALLPNGDKSDKDVLELAMLSFIDKWTEEGMPHPDDMDVAQQQALAPRTPGIAKEMLWNYIQKRKPFLQNINVLAIERPFAVPLYPDNPDILYIGRLDKEYEDDRGRVNVGEHKTTSLYSKDYGIRPSYFDSFSPNSQVDGYLHALHMKHGDKAKSVMVDAALVHKKIHDKFRLLPIEKQFTMLDVWLHETRNWIERIMKDDWALAHHDPDTGILDAFPKADCACFEFGKMCVYRDVCAIVGDPTDRDPPPGMEIKQWSPFDVLKIEKLGLEPEV